MPNPKSLTASITIERDGVEVEIFVHGKLWPGRPAVHYLRNGDPGYPAEEAEMELLGADDGKGNPVELTEAEEALADQALWGRHGIESEPDDVPDWREER